MKENLKPCVYKLWERSGELRLLARLTSSKEGSRRDTKCEERVKSVGVDPKPGDLSMSRLKFP